MSKSDYIICAVLVIVALTYFLISQIGGTKFDSSDITFSSSVAEVNKDILKDVSPVAINPAVKYHSENVALQTPEKKIDIGNELAKSVVKQVLDEKIGDSLPSENKDAGNMSKTSATTLVNTVSGGKKAGEDSPAKETIFGDLLTKTSQKETVLSSEKGIPSISKDKISMTPKEKSGIVKITGKDGEATGFFAIINDTPMLVSNLHVLGGIKDFSIMTMSGDEVPCGKIFVAENHDIAIMPLQKIPEGCYAFEFADRINSLVMPNDDIIVCGNSKGGGSMLETLGTIIAVGPNLVETDCPFYEGNSGSPIFHYKTHKVIGVVSHMKSDKPYNQYEQTSREDARSAIKKDIRYFGYRFDTIKKWIPISPEKLAEQSEFLDKCANRYYAIRQLAVLLNGGTYNLSEFADLNDVATRFIKYKGQNFQRARKELAEKVVNYCASEIGKLNTTKTISNFDERKENIKGALREIETIFREALRI